jgi:RyR domain
LREASFDTQGEFVRRAEVFRQPAIEVRVTYQPHPIETSHIELSQEIIELTERLSEHAHEVWAKQRLADGWSHGPERNDAKKQHPSLVPYAELSESEKQYDRNAALETIKALLALGYRIEPSR